MTCIWRTLCSANKIDMLGRTAAVLPWGTTLPWEVILPGAGGIAIVDGPIPIGDAIAIGIVGRAIVIEVGIKVGDLVSDLVKKCKPKVCPPCPQPRPPETRSDHVPPSRPHHPCKGTYIHTYISKYNQNQKTCECFEVKEEKVDCL